MTEQFKTLKVFQESHAFVLTIYKATKGFPKNEEFGLVSQIRRAAVSIVANLVEGNSRNHKKEFLQFLFISKGSLEEVNYYLLLAHDLGYISKGEYDLGIHQAETVGKLLQGLISYWRRK